MKNTLIFLTLLLIALGSAGQNQIDSSSANTNHSRKTTKNAEKIFFSKADQCLSQIETAAQKISIKGVAIVAYIPGDITKTWISKMKVVGNLTSGKSNLLGIAYTKASEMADTHRNSGSKIREIYSGELGYQGGLIKKISSGYLLAVFSGGSGEQDLEVAKIGLDWLSKFYQPLP
jgi:hypothetical protein